MSPPPPGPSPAPSSTVSLFGHLPDVHLPEELGSTSEVQIEALVFGPGGELSLGSVVPGSDGTFAFEAPLAAAEWLDGDALFVRVRRQGEVVATSAGVYVEDIEGGDVDLGAIGAGSPVRIVPRGRRRAEGRGGSFRRVVVTDEPTSPAAASATLKQAPMVAGITQRLGLSPDLVGELLDVGPQVMAILSADPATRSDFADRPASALLRMDLDLPPALATFLHEFAPIDAALRVRARSERRSPPVTVLEVGSRCGCREGAQ